MSVHFLYFLFKSKRVKPTSMSNKIWRKWNFNSTSQKKIKKIKKNKERERERERERSKNKTPEKFSLVKLLIHCHKLSLLPLLVRRWRKFEKQKLMLNFESCYWILLLLQMSYIFIATTKDLNVLQISTENKIFAN